MALEVMYGHKKKGIFSNGILIGLSNYFWHHVISQPKALKNRLKIVEDVVSTRLVKHIENGNTNIRVLNIGGGSSRALIHTISRFKEDGHDLNVKIVNIDKDARAIEVGKRVAEEHGLENVFDWIHDDARNLDSIVSPESFDIVEMVGLMDYFDHERSVKVIKGVYNSMKKGSLFVVANVKPNNEMKFVERTGWPDMVYRSLEDVEQVLKDSGFNDDINFIMEPMGVHIVAVVEK